MNCPAFAPPVPPEKLLIVKTDTLGDLVIFAGALHALRAQAPHTKVAVLIRAGYLDLAPLLGDGIEWLTTSIDPFSAGPDAALDEVARLSAAVATFAPDAFVAATSRPHWLETVLACRSGARRRITLGETADDAFFATQLRVTFGNNASTAFTEFLTVPAGEADWQRNFRWVDALLGLHAERHFPALTVPGDARARGAAALGQLNLSARRFVVCAAAGFANVKLKTWPAERFAAVLRHVKTTHSLDVLLIGHADERSYLEDVARLAAPSTRVWTGGSGELPVLAALIAEAALFVGNDTGAMHLAAALAIPTVAVFGGGTWPRFVPASSKALAVVQPLPCFGCGWNCAFGDAPCIGLIPTEEVSRAVDTLLTAGPQALAEVRSLTLLPVETRDVMGKAAACYRTLNTELSSRQHKLEDLTALDHEKDEDILGKDKEIKLLKSTCDDREALIVTLDNRWRIVAADLDLLRKTLADLPPEKAAAARALSDQSIHIRNIESLLMLRDKELGDLKATIENLRAGRHDLEQAKHYGRLLSEKESVIRSLRLSCEHRETVIRQLTAESTGITATLRKLGLATQAFWSARIQRPASEWLFASMVEHYWMQIGILRHYDPRPLRWDDALPGPRLPDATLPQIGIVTPSYGQERFIERSMRSVLDQQYPKLRYVVQDGGSKDNSAEIIRRYASRLQAWESVKDKGQADAIGRGFKHIESALGAGDIMAWLNSDDLLGPGVLRFVAEYFARHPRVDVIYGHRIIIDDDDRDVGRWIMPRHHALTLEWIDYIPQETLFWRKRAWDQVGGIDPSFQFALDWDLLARFQQAGCSIVRVPYFFGAFRVHPEQKTSQAIHTVGAQEMRRVRTRFHGDKQDDGAMIERYARHTRFWGAITARLHEIGIRW